MPFGLCNAPSVFQRLMTKILKPYQQIATVYLDDILIWSTTVDEHLEKLGIILNLLEEEGLTLNLAKCKFLSTSVSYLGYEITQEGVRPGEEKINSVKNFPRPTTVRQVRQFLGLSSYFRQFVKDFSVISKPLTILTHKNVAWKWNDEQEIAFNRLKNILGMRPLLAIYNPEAETEVHCDASQSGLAGVLLQKVGDKMHPVYYFSKQTSKTEAKYHSYELETLAVVRSLEKFRVYLLGKKFKVVTDCSAITTANTKKDLVPRIARWWLLLQEYDFTVEHRSGTKMRHVDALSRNPVEIATILRIEPADWVLSAQLTDAKLKHIRDVLSKPPTTDYDHKIYKDYALRNNRIYRITVRGIQWVVPKGMHQSVHDQMGHFSVEKNVR